MLFDTWTWPMNMMSLLHPNLHHIFVDAKFDDTHTTCNINHNHMVHWTLGAKCTKPPVKLPVRPLKAMFKALATKDVNLLTLWCTRLQDTITIHEIEYMLSIEVKG